MRRGGRAVRLPGAVIMLAVEVGPGMIFALGMMFGSSLLSLTCSGGYRIFGRSIHRTLMLEVVGIGGHLDAGGSHCSIPQLKPDKQLLINSQAVYRPSLVENSRVTMSSVEQ
jgi:hypothetical protein